MAYYSRLLILCSFFFSASPFYAQRPFDCGAAYLSVGESNATRLYKLEVNNKGTQIVPSLLVTVQGVKLNGFGFRRQDRFMYATKDAKNSDNTTSLYRIDADGKATELAKLPLDPTYAYFAADVSPDGRYYTILGNTNKPALFYTVDLLSGTYDLKTIIIPNADISAPDIAYSVNGDKLYVEDANAKELLEVDLDKKIVAKRYPSNFGGSLLFSGLFGFDCALFGYVRSSGSFIRIETIGKNQTIGTAKALNSINFAQSAGIDACACPQTVKFEKTASKIVRPDTCSRDYRFVFTLDNECNTDQKNITFKDIMPADFTIQSIDRQPFGGNIIGGVGQKNIEIQGMTITSVKDSIVITASLAPVFKDSIFKNQAILKNLTYPDGGLYDQVSDNPATIKSNDSTVIKAPLLVKFNRDTVSVCETGDIVLKPNAQGRELQYLWNNNATAKEIRINQPGLYIVTVTTECFLSIDSQVVIKKPLRVNIGDDVTVFPGDSVPYTPDYQYFNPIIKKEWTVSAGAKIKCKNCINNLARPFGEETTVKLRLQDEQGCIAEDEAKIRVRRNIYIPNAFSPNDDGINDRFFINTEKDAKIVLLDIYNRWGDLVYHTENQCFTNHYECAWDGTFKGVAQKSDAFTYRAVIDFGDGILFSYKGGIDLVK